MKLKPFLGQKPEPPKCLFMIYLFLEKPKSALEIIYAEPLSSFILVQLFDIFFVCVFELEVKLTCFWILVFMIERPLVDKAWVPQDYSESCFYFKFWINSTTTIENFKGCFYDRTPLLFIKDEFHGTTGGCFIKWFFSKKPSKFYEHTVNFFQKVFSLFSWLVRLCEREVLLAGSCK